jgi:hypothetical protein
MLLITAWRIPFDASVKEEAVFVVTRAQLVARVHFRSWTHIESSNHYYVSVMGESLGGLAPLFWSA